DLDVIHYTVVATNDGNTTLSNVTVTDAQVSNLSCSPSNPVASLAPGSSLTCSASHTIVQADVDAGSFFNQACVDDGAGGAAKACDDVTTPGSQNPPLAINKTATKTGVSKTGDVMPYNIVASNDVHVTMHGVTVTDPNAAALSFTPTNGSDLSPCATLSLHDALPILQADVDAGSFFNQACVDDGAGGAAKACDDVTTPGSQNPAITIDKTSTT